MLISLMNYAFKAFLKISYKKYTANAKKNNTQFDFKTGTRETLYCMQLFVQKWYDQRKDIFI